MGLHNPPHPGRSIRRDCLEALGLTVTDGAKILGITRHMLSRILNGQAGISPEMAVRLEKAFGGTAQSWLALQQTYDLAQVNRGKINVRPASSALEEARGLVGVRRRRIRTVRHSIANKCPYFSDSHSFEQGRMEFCLICL